MRYFEPGIHAQLGPALRPALRQWDKLVEAGPPRKIVPASNAPADVVLFTDGFAPDLRKNESGLPAVGAVLFARCRARPAQFFEEVPQEVLDAWLPRKTQICMVELVGAVIALETSRDYLHGKAVILLVDAEAVEGALVKGTRHGLMFVNSSVSSGTWLWNWTAPFISIGFPQMRTVQTTLQGTSCRSVSHLAGKRFWLGGPGRFGLMVGPGDVI